MDSYEVDFIVESIKNAYENKVKIPLGKFDYDGFVLYNRYDCCDRIKRDKVLSEYWHGFSEEHIAEQVLHGDIMAICDICLKQIEINRKVDFHKFGLFHYSCYEQMDELVSQFITENKIINGIDTSKSRVWICYIEMWFHTILDVQFIPITHFKIMELFFCLRENKKDILKRFRENVLWLTIENQKRLKKLIDTFEVYKKYNFELTGITKYQRAIPILNKYELFHDRSENETFELVDYYYEYSSFN
ncbi:MAG: hypothetical protein INQ03_04260 [Candidatus Heimdallarchaeota archaeon]|nr:hypothetical protein [Candidatus Heimdallarchaeota archaeon]